MLAEGTVLEVDKDLRQRLGISPTSSILKYVRIKHRVTPITDKFTIERIEGPVRKPGLSNAGRKRKARPGIKREYERMQKQSKCKDCSATCSIIHDQIRADLVCTECGSVQERTFGGETGDGAADFAERAQHLITKRARTSNATCYENANHFRDILMQAQGIESMRPPEGLLEKLHEYMRKNKIEPSTLTPADTFKILRETKLSRLYQHRVKITYWLSGKPPFTLTEEQSRLLCTNFQQIQQPWREAIAKSQRKNLMSYSYILFKLCEMHGITEMCDVCYLLKTNNKLRQLDAHWETICARLNWPYRPSPPFNFHHK